MASALENIKILREKTGAGLGACKQALAECKDNVEEAVVYLRKKGLADMAKRAGRETKEGRLAVKTSADGKYTAMAYLGCETDFVAKTPDFIGLTEKIADYMLANTAVTDFVNDEALGKVIHEVAPRFGENVSFTKAELWTLSGKCGVINYYLHSDNKKGAMVEIACKQQDGSCCSKKAEVMEIARNLAMQAVGMVAQYLNESDVPEADIAREKDIAITQARNEGKPEAAIEKMIPGRIHKYCKDVCLMEQPYMKDSKLSVKDYFAQATKDLGLDLEVVRFVRF